MSDASGGPGWWVASDGKWYPPESHAPAAAPPAPAKRRGCLGLTLGVALGVVLGAVVLIVVVVALIGGGVDRAVKKANRPALVRIEAAPEVCWTITITSTSSGLQQNQQDGCGPGTYDLRTGLGRNAIVTKKTAGGVLTAVLVVDGKETARQTTNATYGSVTLSP